MPLDEAAVRVEDVEQLVGVQAVRGGEEHDFEMLAHALEKLDQVRPQAHKNGELLPAVLDGKLARVTPTSCHGEPTLVAQFCSSSVEQCTSVSSWAL